MTTDVAGRRVLVVEDEHFIVLHIEEVLLALGCEVVGPTGKLETALQFASEEALDAAILDITVRGGQIFPVAEKLLSRGIPFVLASGYGNWTLPANLRDRPRLTKPFTSAELEAQVRAVCSTRRERKSTSDTLHSP